MGRVHNCSDPVIFVLEVKTTQQTKTHIVSAGSRANSCGVILPKARCYLQKRINITDRLLLVVNMFMITSTREAEPVCSSSCSHTPNPLCVVRICAAARRRCIATHAPPPEISDLPSLRDRPLAAASSYTVAFSMGEDERPNVSAMNQLWMCQSLRAMLADT